MSTMVPPATDTQSSTRWTSEGVDFLRRVMGGEVYTGMSGEALALWVVGIHDEPRNRPYDRGDFRRCMNVYWSAPASLRPRMREQLETWAARLHRASGGVENWRYIKPDFDVPAYYEPSRWHEVRL